MLRRWPWLLLLLALVGCDNSHHLSVPATSSLPSSDGQTGPIRVYFTRPGAPAREQQVIVNALVGYIQQAKETIDVAAFELDNQVITNALLEAVKRGVRVRLVTETGYLEESGTKALKTAGVPVVDDRRDGALMHNKFMVFDNRTVWTGSMNFTENCAYRNNNHGIFLDDSRIAANYATKFSWMFEQRKFGGVPYRTAKIPNPVVTLDDGTVVENYFSTHDHIADHVIEKIQAARSSIHFLAFSFTHTGMGRAMLSRAASGVPVQGVFEKSQALSGYSEYARFRAAGSQVQVYLDANPRNMHHKVIIVDGATTVAGSFNFSDGADKSNDENVVIIANRDIAHRFDEEFQRIYGDAKKAEAGQPMAVSHKR
jgi:phosphatidylserine/phosphatidylglycerophosphate/cardiolipin synthase-like enzyme